FFFRSYLNLYLLSQLRSFPTRRSSALSISLEGDYPLPPNSPFATLYLTGGKKDKINKIDIVGFLLNLPDVQKDQIGLIEVKDREAFVAIDRTIAAAAIKLANGQKIKGKKVKVGGPSLLLQIDRATASGEPMPIRRHHCRGCRGRLWTIYELSPISP